MSSKLKKGTTGYRVFTVFNYIIVLLLALVCLLPMLNVLAISFSGNLAVSRGEVSFWPKEFTTVAYEYLLADEAFWRSMLISIIRVILGVGISMFLIILTAYPLSMSSQKFPKRRIYAWYFVFTMLFGGGLIPTFLTVRYTGLMDTIWALVIPGALSAYNLILMLNFFRQLPEGVSEAAYIDGAGHWKILWMIIVPMSKPALATIALFVAVAHWNEWFNAMIFMKHVDHYPLQTYLQSMIISSNFQVTNLADLQTLSRLSNRTVNSAQIFVGMLPILCVYPFLQKYFTKGIVLGSVKG
ncbi:Inner membrane ABC transporter permease protein ycjP [uncultured Ruminococcus sp.]|uniref:Carbohydrate ABC transporter permease n=1 Tax=Massiliimalia timonensis TaxID=1987501 RepID=A0A8J6TY95_9FIRM|nr:carbohydrate ABC transporter permease [Massiliimalia timonensis]MBC8609612.1 carbohydrate ABC transporter permease [Massiliimalia timonensis]SCH34910.1 Inner membrane ABC transporter permease protein ycjP [uncultured Ruminococcus sp.]SCH37212.1 Inner membrane ABC transporter permease protein ycjP [uncultured Clostridium sp.]